MQQLKHVIIAISFTALLSGMAYSQCISPSTQNDNSASTQNDNGDSISENEFIVDTSSQGYDGTQGTTPQNDTIFNDTSSNGNSPDTGMQNGNDSTAPDTGMQNGNDGNAPDTGIQNGNDGERSDSSMNNGNDGAMNTPPKFDPNAVDSVTGHVLSINTLSEPDAENQVTLSLRMSDGNTAKVFLAPESFVKDLNFSVNKGDSVKVVGSQSKPAQNQTTIVASKVIKDGTTYLFRDQKGSPFWPEINQ